MVAVWRDQLLGFLHNNLFHFILRMHPDQEVGLARARSLGPSVSHNDASWHRPSRALPRFEPCQGAGLARSHPCFFAVVLWRGVAHLKDCQKLSMLGLDHNLGFLNVSSTAVTNAGLAISSRR